MVPHFDDDGVHLGNTQSRTHLGQTRENRTPLYDPDLMIAMRIEDILHV